MTWQEFRRRMLFGLERREREIARRERKEWFKAFAHEQIMADGTFRAKLLHEAALRMDESKALLPPKFNRTLDYVAAIERRLAKLERRASNDQHRRAA